MLNFTYATPYSNFPRISLLYRPCIDIVKCIDRLSRPGHDDDVKRQTDGRALPRLEALTFRRPPARRFSREDEHQGRPVKTYEAAYDVVSSLLPEIIRFMAVDILEKARRARKVAGLSFFADCRGRAGDALPCVLLRSPSFDRRWSFGGPLLTEFSAREAGSAAVPLSQAADLSS